MSCNDTKEMRNVISDEDDSKTRKLAEGNKEIDDELIELSQGKLDGRIAVHENPDQGLAWLMAFCCFLINAIVFGLLRTYGVLYVTILETYQVNREIASWPFSLCSTTLHLMALVSGSLSNYFKIRTIVISGCLISSVGVTLCYFASSIMHVILLFGFINGIGIGFLCVQGPVIINKYFVKYRATANGISFAGGTFGSFLFPPLVEFILIKYTLRGCFLILGGILLNTLPLAFLIREPVIVKRNPYVRKTRSSKKGRDAQLEFAKTANGKDVNDEPLYHKNFESKIMQNSIDSPLIQPHLDKKTIFDEETAAIKVFGDDPDSLDKDYSFSESLLTKNHEIEVNRKNERNNNMDTIATAPKRKVRKVPSSRLPLKSYISNNVKLMKTILSTPHFWVICLTHISFICAWTTYIMVVVDFAKDRGIGINESVLLLSAFSAADLVGRLGSGFISDHKVLKRETMCFMCILSVGVLLNLSYFARSFHSLLFISGSLGFFSGSLVILFSVLLAEHLGLDKIALALGTSCFFCGLATLFRPKIVGWFRDYRGSYDNLFQALGFLCLFAASLWIIIPLRDYFQRRTSRIEVRENQV